MPLVSLPKWNRRKPHLQEVNKCLLLWDALLHQSTHVGHGYISHVASTPAKSDKRYATWRSAIPSLLLFPVQTSFGSAMSAVPLARECDLLVCHVYASWISYIIHRHLSTYENMSSFLVRDGIHVVLYSNATNCLSSPPYSTPHVAPCTISASIARRLQEFANRGFQLYEL